MRTQRQLPEFATAAWYADATDHRCPHDAWLESLEISEPAHGQRKEKRKTSIIIRLLGAFHDGEIILRYSDVKRFALGSATAECGLGDWLDDRVSIFEGSLRHDITWCFGSEKKTSWFIEADAISYEWIKKEANQAPEPTAAAGRGSS